MIVYNKTRTSSCQRTTVKVSVCLHSVGKSLLGILLASGDIDSRVPDRGQRRAVLTHRVNKYLAALHNRAFQQVAIAVLSNALYKLGVIEI